MGFGVEQADIDRAQLSIRQYIDPSPLVYSQKLSGLLGRDIFLKQENRLTTGSFKERGVISFLSQLLTQKTRVSVCAASAGNHALALSYYTRSLNIPCTIIMPRRAPLVKVEATEKNGARVILEGESFHEAYAFAQNFAKQETLIFVPPFDHPDIIAGQASVGLEILEQLPNVDCIATSVGGGGLIAGIALAVKGKRPDVAIHGIRCRWAENARLHTTPASPFAAGSIADGIAVKQLGHFTKPIISALVDGMHVVDDNEIGQAVVRYLELERAVIEGSAAVPLAAAMEGLLPQHAKKTVLVITGSNIDLNLLSRLIDREMRDEGRLFRVRVFVSDKTGTLAALTALLAKAGANILETNHERSFSRLPSGVDISFRLEARNEKHQNEIVQTLIEAGLAPEVMR